MEKVGSGVTTMKPGPTMALQESLGKREIGGYAVTKPASVMQELLIRRERKIAELDEIEKAIVALEKHPEVEECLTLLHQVGVHR